MSLIVFERDIMMNLFKRKIAVMMVPVLTISSLCFSMPVRAEEINTENSVMSENSKIFGDEEVETQSYSEKKS